MSFISLSEVKKFFILYFTVKPNVYQKLDKIGIFIDMKFH